MTGTIHNSILRLWATKLAAVNQTRIQLSSSSRIQPIVMAVARQITSSQYMSTRLYTKLRLLFNSKLFAHLDIFKAPSLAPNTPPPLPLPPYERPKCSYSLKKGPPFSAVPLRSLTVRINEPYWVLHRGNCEHWLVIDEIRYACVLFLSLCLPFRPFSCCRLQNPRDPSSGYPVTIQRTPTFLPLCRICSKVPAMLSIINDVRLGL